MCVCVRVCSVDVCSMNVCVMYNTLCRQNKASRTLAAVSFTSGSGLTQQTQWQSSQWSDIPALQKQLHVPSSTRNFAIEHHALAALSHNDFFLVPTDDESLQVQIRPVHPAQLVHLVDIGSTFTPFLWALAYQEYILAEFIQPQSVVYI